MVQQQQEQIEELYTQMFAHLFAYARSVLENDALAEEAVQETFRIACLRPCELCGSPNPQGWLFVTLKNVLRNTKKSMASSQRLLAEYASVYAQKALSSTDQLSLEVSYENLAQHPEYKLLYAWAVEGKTLLEISQELRISLAACKKRLQRAKAFLQKKL